mmetsp:Transcript_5443/g.15253  ORF Transcript_5443/g.15253 Transcript_5443/m.15253 type:complete len:205 (-) Transcript_5443:1220-1834(-)
MPESRWQNERDHERNGTAEHRPHDEDALHEHAHQKGTDEDHSSQAIPLRRGRLRRTLLHDLFLGLESVDGLDGAPAVHHASGVLAPVSVHLRPGPRAAEAWAARRILQRRRAWGRGRSRGPGFGRRAAGNGIRRCRRRRGVLLDHHQCLCQLRRRRDVRAQGLVGRGCGLQAEHRDKQSEERVPAWLHEQREVHHQHEAQRHPA